MKIGFDVSQTGREKAGCGYFADSLIQALAAAAPQEEFLLYPHFGDGFWDPQAPREARRLATPRARSIVVAGDRAAVRDFWATFPANGEEVLGRPDIVHANNFFCPRGLRRARLVYTLHDLSFLFHPEFTTEENRRVCFDGVFSAACRADFIVANSDYTRRSFLETFPHYPADRVRVVPLGSRFSALPASCGGRPTPGLAPGCFWLAVGTLEPRKNLRRLLAAYSRHASSSRAPLPLVLAGGRGWLEDDLADYIASLGIEGLVRLTGYVADEELIWLYRNCRAFLYPSLYEGFGLPVLEALSLGAAVVTSNATSLPEVAGEAAWYVDPLEEGEIAAALEGLADDEKRLRHLRSRAAAQAAGFSWEACAAAVLEVYAEVLRRPKYEGGNGDDQGA